MDCSVDRKQIHGAVPFEASTMGVVDASDSSFDLCFRALGVAAVIGHVQYAACLEFGQNGGIFLDDEEHGARFVAPNLELVERMGIVYRKFNAVKASGLHGLINLFYGSGVHFNGSHVNSSGVQWSAQSQIVFFRFIQQILCHFFLRIDGLTACRLHRSDGKNPTAILCRFAAK
jgi:hypothetical protein